MQIEEPTLQEVVDFAREQFALDVDRDRSDMMNLAAIGLTIRAWRNTSLEDLHAGSHPSGGFSDAEMMRSNIATFRVVRDRIESDRFDWEALRIALTDPERELPGGVTVGQLCRHEFERLAADSEEALAISERTERRKGFPYLLSVYALQAGISYKDWFGSPWWPDVVDRFLELINDPASSAWRYDENREVEPREVSNREHLQRALLGAPESLDDDTIYWCLGHGLSRVASFGGFARWRKRREPSWIDPSPWLSE
jgi:hypothetical protein